MDMLLAIISILVMISLLGLVLPKTPKHCQ